MQAELLAKSLATKSRLFLKPPPNLSISQWADKNVVIPAGNAEPGKYRTSRTPYCREPMDCMTDPKVQKVTLMWGAQTGKTQVITNVLGYHIEHKPSNQIMMQPTETDYKIWLQTKFQPMLDSSPVLMDRVAKARGREGVNNQNMKSYPGGWLMSSWSGSESTMRGKSAPIIINDEVDGYDRKSEGDPVELLWKRAATFGERRKQLLTSTPTDKNSSQIEISFLSGDQRYQHVPCHECGCSQKLVWDNVKWDKDEDNIFIPESVRYVCEHCAAEWSDAQRKVNVSRAIWIAEKPFRGHASFHLNSLHSTLMNLKDFVSDFYTCIKKNTLNTFINTVLAETWEEKFDKPDYTVLQNRRENYKKDDKDNRLVPKKVNLITAWADTQDDRLEVGIVGWGVGEESWQLDHYVLEGNPAKSGLWDRLAEVSKKLYTREDGAIMDIKIFGVDSGGHHTNQVYEFCKKNGAYKYLATKGASQRNKPVMTLPKKRNDHGVYLVYVGTDTAKELIYGRYKIVEPGLGYLHFPFAEFATDDYFKQYVCEYPKAVFKKGHKVIEWTKPSHARNEQLDIQVGNLTMVRVLQSRAYSLDEVNLHIEEKKIKKENKSSWVKKPTSNWMGNR